jgi:hypothetical protein
MQVCVFHRFFIRLPRNVKKTVYSRLEDVSRHNDPSLRRSCLDSICPLILQLKWLFRESSVVINYPSNQSLNGSDNSRVAKL